jgi:hypothetical protein
MHTHGDGVCRQWKLGRVSARDSSAGETGVFRLTENGSGRIVTGETGLAHTRTGIQSVPDL